MEPYTPIVPFEVLSARLGRPAAEIVKLDANENPYGPPPGALAALAAGRSYHIYPDPEANALRDGWAIVNDDAHDYALLTVYVDPLRELELLADAGFGSGVTMLGLDGRVAENDLRDIWVHFVARKPATIASS